MQFDSVSKEDSTMKCVVSRNRRLRKDVILGSSTVELASLAKGMLYLECIRQRLIYR